MYKTALIDLDKLNEECGVFGIFARDDLDVSEMTYFGLYSLQHRGQESTGIAIADGTTIKHYKDRGLVSEVFEENRLEELKGGNIAIGHVRYPAGGDTSILNAQPLVIRYKKGYLALAHNGNLTNADQLRIQLEETGAVFQTSTDSEVIANLIARDIDQGLEIAIKNTVSRLKGAYALVLMTEDTLIAIRDPYGMRPLALGQIGDSYVVASESCAFDVVDAEFIRDIKPGEIIIITRDGLKSIQTPTPLKSALCIFEFVYFARTDSVIDGVSVYAARKEAGKILAAEHPVEADLVIGVPDSGTTAALGYAEGSGIPFGEGLIKNRYVGRTFISPGQSMRERGVRIKLNTLKKVVKGKQIVMIDDSIVRGTTSKKIVEMLRMAGAREVHMRISSPPVRFPCYFGIDTPSKDQLIGASYSVDEICRIIGTDSLEYLSMDGLLKTVESSGCDFCLGCFSGEYPVEME